MLFEPGATGSQIFKLTHYRPFNDVDVPRRERPMSAGTQTGASCGGRGPMASARWMMAAVAACSAGAAIAQPTPDLSGVWRTYRAPGQPPPQPRAGRPAIQLPLKPEAKAKVAAYQALVSPNGETPGGMCLGTGMPGSMMGSGGYPMEIVQRRDQINIVYEAHNEIRRVYFGAKAIPEADRVPDRNGYSVGRWQGGRLIVVTDSLKDAVDQGYPHSENAKLTEEYSLSPDGQTLTAKLTIDDPDWYTQAFTTEKKWTLDPKGWLMPYECNEPMWEAHLEELSAKAAGSPPPAK